MQPLNESPITDNLKEYADSRFEKMNGSTDTGYDPILLIMDENDQPLAIIVSHDDSDGESSCYQFVGQHSGISMDYAILRCRSVTALDFDVCQELIRELIRTGYRPMITETGSLMSPREWDKAISTAKAWIGR